jgi:hypothetical protein
VYATSRAALSKTQPGAEWSEDTKFNAGDAILADPTLKDVYKEAILKGCAVAMIVNDAPNAGLSYKSAPNGLSLDTCGSELPTRVCNTDVIFGASYP